MRTDRLVDAHTHVASSDEQRYPRDPTGAGSTWWQDESGVDQLVANLDATGVEQAVVVQAVGVYGYDCRYAADVTAASDGRLAFVGAIDMSGTDLAAEVDALHEGSPMAGLRLFGVGTGGSAWLTNGSGQAMWRFAARTGCVLVPTIFSSDLPALAHLLSEQPDVVVALDHCAFPDLGGPEALAELLGLASHPGLHLKVTSHNLDRDGDPSVLVDALVDAFGPTRVCWGSDHPQHRSKTYPELVDLARHAARNLTAPDRAAFLGENASRLWWPPSTPDPVHGSDSAERS